MDQNRFQMPQRGLPLTDLEAQLQSRLPDSVYGHFSRAFRGPPDVQEAGRRAYNLFISDNGLFSLRADYIRRTEEELIGMCVGLFHAPADASGTFTSGGSESNYTVIHAMREWAREQFPQVKTPELIVPFSAHPTFSKGCHYYGIRLVRTPLGEDRRADPHAIAQAINANTIGLAGSAPCWPYGLVDPIEELGDLASRHGLWLHVDACVGGYLAPFAERIGVTLPKWDFRVPAVMSISADLHKYGYCPKPASTVLWRSESLKRFHHVHPEDWPGGPYHMQGFAGSRSAGPIFAAWTVLRYLGIEGYERLTRDVLDTQQKLRTAIEAIEGLYTLENDLPPLAFGSHSLDMALIMGELRKTGWILVASRQPPLINMPIDPALDERVSSAFIRDLEAAVTVARRGGTGDRGEMRY